MADTSETAGHAMVALGLIRAAKSIQVLALAVKMKLTAIEMGRAIGWLEREGKVAVENGIVSISDGVPTF